MHSMHEKLEKVTSLASESYEEASKAYDKISDIEYKLERRDTIDKVDTLWSHYTDSRMPTKYTEEQKKEILSRIEDKTTSEDLSTFGKFIDRSEENTDNNR